MQIVPFSDARSTDLRVDAVYQGGRMGNAGDDPRPCLYPRLFLDRGHRLSLDLYLGDVEIGNAPHLLLTLVRGAGALVERNLLGLLFQDVDIIHLDRRTNITLTPEFVATIKRQAQVINLSQSLLVDGALRKGLSRVEESLPERPEGAKIETQKGGPKKFTEPVYFENGKWRRRSPGSGRKTLWKLKIYKVFIAVELLEKAQEIAAHKAVSRCLVIAKALEAGFEDAVKAFREEIFTENTRIERLRRLQRAIYSG